MTLDNILQELTLASNRMTAQAVLLERAQDERDALIFEASQSGGTHPTIGAACGLTDNRIKQIVRVQRAVKKEQDR